jgi:hypothetical protein
MAWTVDRLTQHLGIPEETAQQVLALVRGRKDPLQTPETRRWADSCYHRPSGGELVMHALDQLLETSGVEVIEDPADPRQAAALYLNAGDTYTPTILFDSCTRRYRLTTWGDFVEALEAEQLEA